jgi:serine/threonine protein phosphatase 1
VVAATPPCDGDVYARLVRSRRVWAVASIHGEVDRLTTLHARLASRLEPGDRLVYLGDYLGYGEGSAATLDALILFRRLFLARRNAFLGDIAFLRGTQEEMWHKLLELQFAPNPREVLPWMLEHGLDKTLTSYALDVRDGLAACREGVLALTRWTATVRAAIDARSGHRHLLNALRRAALTDDGALLLVHASVDPAKPLDLQGDNFWWGDHDILKLTGPFAGYRRVIRGTDRNHAGVVESPFAVSIDAGSGFGGPLLAVCLAPDGSIAEQIEA